MMPVEPVVPDGSRLLVFGKDQQDTYIPLPAVVDEDGTVTTEWEPTPEELDRLLLGGRIRLRVLTCDPYVGQPGHELQPVGIQVLEPECGFRES